MAIVPNKDGMGIIANGFTGNVDPRYETPNRSGAGGPAGSIVSLYTDERYYDTTGQKIYMSLVGGTNNNWIAADQVTL